jgi:hypothetical protein
LKEYSRLCAITERSQPGPSKQESAQWIKAKCAKAALEKWPSPVRF